MTGYNNCQISNTKSKVTMLLIQLNIFKGNCNQSEVKTQYDSIFSTTSDLFINLREPELCQNTPLSATVYRTPRPMSNTRWWLKRITANTARPVNHVPRNTTCLAVRTEFQLKNKNIYIYRKQSRPERWTVLLIQQRTVNGPIKINKKYIKYCNDKASCLVFWDNT